MTNEQLKQAFWQGNNHLRKPMIDAGILENEVKSLLDRFVLDGVIPQYDQQTVQFIIK